MLLLFSVHNFVFMLRIQLSLVAHSYVGLDKLFSKLKLLCS